MPIGRHIPTIRVLWRRNNQGVFGQKLFFRQVFGQRHCGLSENAQVILAANYNKLTGTFNQVKVSARHLYNECLPPNIAHGMPDDPGFLDSYCRKDGVAPGWIAISELSMVGLDNLHLTNLSHPCWIIDQGVSNRRNTLSKWASAPSNGSVSPNIART
jgi:hypothetical protein